MVDRSATLEIIRLFNFNFYWFFKNLYNIMANVKLTFFGSEISKTTEHQLTCFYNTKNEIFISINDEFICFDKSTAIKLAKTLRTEINKID